VIQKHVQDPLAELILSGQVHDGEALPLRLGPAGLMIGDVTVTKEKRPVGVPLQ
jgi:ATP-dependent Clp protease ATP-binding subunit ClpB